jgi:hypothetical protein
VNSRLRLDWQKIRTNNPLERIMREIRRRTRIVGAFPDGQSRIAAGFSVPGTCKKPTLAVVLLEQRSKAVFE